MHSALIFAALAVQDPTGALAPDGVWPAPGASLSSRPSAELQGSADRAEVQVQAQLLRKPGMRRRDRTVLLRQGTALRVSSVKEVGVHADVLPVLQPYADRSLVTVQLDRSYAGYAAVVGIGNLRERGHLSGGLSRSALAPGSVHSHFAALSLKMPLSRTWGLVGTLWHGRRTGEIWAGSLQRVGGSLFAFSATLAGQGMWTEDDRMTLALTLPKGGGPAGPALQGMLLPRADGSFTYALRPMAAWGAHVASELDLGYSRSLAPNTTLTGAARLPLTGAGLPARGAAGLQLGIHLSHRF